MGCPALAHVNVSHCVKLTDLSLRAVADGCIRLGLLDISGCPRMSDIGLRYLSVHCRDLHTLGLRSTILISDGLSLGRENAQGLAALSHGCKRLQHLDLTKCIRVDDAACKQIGRGFHDLRTLILFGCCSVSSTGVRDVSRQCHKLTLLDLSHCRLVDDTALVAIGGSDGGMPLLQSLRLRECEKVTTAGIQQLCKGCIYIRTLDLAGCHRLDDMALLAICDHLTELQHLWLAGLHSITIIGVSWLADRCINLMELDVTVRCHIASYFDTHTPNSTQNSAISYMALKPLRAAWKYGDLREHGKVRGIVPKYRAMDMMFLDHYGTCWKAAIRIQVQLLARRDAARRREQALVHWAASKMQSVFRGRQARQYAAVQRMLRRRQHDAATRIQVGPSYEYNPYPIRIQDLMNQPSSSSSPSFQASYRAHVARTLAERLRKQRDRDRYVRMVIRVQSAWRRKKARDVFNSKRLLKQAWEARRQIAAAVLQRAFRAYGWRNRNSLFSTALKAKKAEQQAAANKLQSLYRGRAARLEAQQKRQALKLFERKKEHAAMCLQRVIRRRRENRLHQRRLDEDAAARSAATKIQRRFRRRQDMLSYQLMKIGREFQLRTDAALRLQAAWRRKQGHMAKHMLRVLKDEQYQRRANAATKLQTRWRGRLGRAAAAQAQQAAIQCWHAIHAGGRRRKHCFRTLFDYYGKRIDYGDGEFPSVWPSEIAQDELDGWYLRTSPFREPSLVLGDWEKYVDDTSHREWYFNPTTKMSTYLPPNAFKATAEDVAKAWVIKQEAANHVAYYFNERTGQRTFERPPTFVENGETMGEAELDEGGFRGGGVDEGSTGAIQEAAATNEDATPYGMDMGNGWTQYWDDTYQVYYYFNTYTQESTYTPPDGAVESIAL
ncbi:hypothetical protein B5M09_008379 [Aphanomyces astaci]|uniref:WW domain-containing protein n=1 Tax=Aphanomyces astaci TaxID=112090 RepID=A0A3R7XT92_APHAT|nr:hypothetical protein B5M09_008379 [Aphanomyces astaci]